MVSEYIRKKFRTDRMNFFIQIFPTYIFIINEFDKPDR